MNQPTKPEFPSVVYTDYLKLPTTEQPQASTGVSVKREKPTFGPESQRMICPHCHSDIMTRVIEDGSNSAMYCLAGMLCALGNPFAFLLWRDICNVKNHYCPSCNEYLLASVIKSWSTRSNFKFTTFFDRIVVERIRNVNLIAFKQFFSPRKKKLPLVFNTE